jgi:hypothetical protein
MTSIAIPPSIHLTKENQRRAHRQVPHCKKGQPPFRFGKDGWDAFSDAQKCWGGSCASDNGSNMDEAAGFDPRSSIARTVLLTRASALSLHDRQRRGLIVDVELPLRQSRQSAVWSVQAASESGWASS